MGKKTTKTLASYFWHKEMQRCITISTLDHAYNHNQMKVKDLVQKIQDLYHGKLDDPNSVGLSQLFLEGKKFA